MKTLLLLLISTVILFANIGKITAVKGTVIVERGVEKLKGKSGLILKVNDVIITKKRSRAIILFNDNTSITVGKNSKLSVNDFVLDVKKPKKSKANFGFGKGIFRTITGKIGKLNPDGFKLKTKSASIGIRGSDGTTIVSADGGVKHVTNSGGFILTDDATGKSVDIPKGSTGSITPTGVTVAPTTKADLEETNELSGDNKGFEEEEVKEEEKEEEVTEEKKEEEEAKEEEKDKEEELKEEEKEEKEEATKEEKKEEEEVSKEESKEDEVTKEDKETEEVTEKEKNKEEITQEEKEDVVEDKKESNKEETVQQDKKEQNLKDDETTTKNEIQEEQKTEQTTQENKTQNTKSSTDTNLVEDNFNEFVLGESESFKTDIKDIKDSIPLREEDKTNLNDKKDEIEVKNDVIVTIKVDDLTKVVDDVTDTSTEQQNSIPSLQFDNNKYIDAGTTFSIKISAIDADSSDTLVYSIISGPSNGSASINSSTGVIDYIVPSSISSDTSDSMVVSVSDGHGGTDQKTITFNIIAAVTALSAVSLSPDGEITNLDSETNKISEEIAKYTYTQSDDTYLEFGYWTEDSSSVPDSSKRTATYLSGMTTPNIVIDDYIQRDVTASYSGKIAAFVTNLSGTTVSSNGSVNLNLDFGNKNITGQIDVTQGNWKAAVNSGSIYKSATTNRYEFTSTSISSAVDSSVNEITGKMDGKFYGANVDAVGGTFKLESSSAGSVNGVFGGRKVD